MSDKQGGVASELGISETVRVAEQSNSKKYESFGQAFPRWRGRRNPWSGSGSRTELLTKKYESFTQFFSKKLRGGGAEPPKKQQQTHQAVSRHKYRPSAETLLFWYQSQYRRRLMATLFLY